MTQYFNLHQKKPQMRLISQAVAIIRAGGVIVYPTDSGYALGCHIGDKKSLDKIRRIRLLDKNHNFTLVCRDLSELSHFAVVNNATYRMIKSYTPGPYTFILKATSEVPKRLQHPKKKTIGIRVPKDPVAQALLEGLGEPIMSTSLIMPHQTDALCDESEIYQQLHQRVDLIIHAGETTSTPTTVIDLLNDVPKILRQGKGEFHF
jgi:tRNA threonylcarbamoyl adenosine modification protein (Sua5/YciO/YrdC/YwlC family)